VGDIPVRVNPASPQWPTGGNYVAQTWFARPGGPKLNPGTVYGQMGDVSHQARWFAQHHLTEWIAYQPHSHLVWLTLARNGLLVAAAAFLVLASAWWLRQHPAE
jgi:hypothetical protein